MKFILPLFFFFLASAQGAESRLEFSEGAFAASVKWEQGPRSPQESVLKLEWKSGADNSAAEAPGKFRVMLWMPDMNHGSAPTKVKQLVDGSGQPILGAYQISNLFFTMPGKWEIKFSVKYPDGGEETKTIPVEIKAAR